jgi:hypothetical protein
MLLSDPEVGLSVKGGNVAGRQGGGRKIMSVIVKQNKPNLRNVTWGETREGSPLSRG